MKKLYLFLFLLVFFSFLIFILKSYFFGSFDELIIKEAEEKYIEPSIIKTEYLEQGFENDIEQDIVIDENVYVSLKSAYNINFSYIPDFFYKETIAYTNILKIFLNSNLLDKKVGDLGVEMHKYKNDVRGKMKERSIKLFGVKSMSYSEFLAVGIHELSHYIDIYILKRNSFYDISNYFYEHSWDSTKVLKKGQTIKDFVSGYSMTNKYEDFSESFTYYLLHNKDFLKKSEESDILKGKYDFFTKYLFKNEEFVGTDFSEDNEVEFYYRDITKIDFSIKNFLIFFKKGI